MFKSPIQNNSNRSCTCSSDVSCPWIIRLWCNQNGTITTVVHFPKLTPSQENYEAQSGQSSAKTPTDTSQNQHSYQEKESLGNGCRPGGAVEACQCDNLNCSGIPGSLQWIPVYWFTAMEAGSPASRRWNLGGFFMLCHHMAGDTWQSGKERVEGNGREWTQSQER